MSTHTTDAIRTMLAFVRATRDRDAEALRTLIPEDYNDALALVVASADIIHALTMGPFQDQTLAYLIQQANKAQGTIPEE